MNTQITADHDLIQCHVCPVCKKQMKSGLKDTHRSLKQHMARHSSIEHQLWKQMFWKIHFVVGGYNHQPRKYSPEEIQEIVQKYFHVDVPIAANMSDEII